MTCPVLLALLILVFPVPAEEPGNVCTLPMPDRLEVEDALLADLDGDGLDDLLIGASNRARLYGRTLRAHMKVHAGVCFSIEPSLIFNMAPDVVAFAAGDVEPDPGKEVVLFTAGGAYSWATAKGVEVRPRKLVDTDLLWQLPHPFESFHWANGVMDLDGDGLDDLILPEPHGYRIAFQDRTEGEGSRFDRVFFLSLPPDPVLEDDSPEANRRRAQEQLNEIRASLSLGASDKNQDPYALGVWDTVPNPVIRDFNGDGRPDLLAQSSGELLVWIQSEGGGFAGTPDLRQQLPLDVDRSRRMDISFNSHATDLDRDGRMDCVILAGEQRSEDQATQVLVYVQGKGKGRSAQTGDEPLFGNKGIPQQLLKVGGFVGSTDLTDVDGNGYPDLVMGTINIDTLDAVSAAASGKLDASLYVYLNQKGTLSRQPNLNRTVSLPVDKLGDVGRRITARFFGDVTGNGVKDLLLRDEPDRFRVHAVRKSRSGRLVVADEPLFEFHFPKRSKIKVHEGPEGRPEVLVFYRSKLDHVRFH